MNHKQTYTPSFCSLILALIQFSHACRPDQVECIEGYYVPFFLFAWNYQDCAKRVYIADERRLMVLN